MEELNKKLAEDFLVATDVRVSVNYSQYPSPTLEMVFRLPNGTIEKAKAFTISLDACFKWLVPKLDKWNITKVFKTADYIVANVWLGDKYAFADAVTPALALCKAIEKLIDGEKDVERPSS